MSEEPENINFSQPSAEAAGDSKPKRGRPPVAKPAGSTASQAADKPAENKVVKLLDKNPVVSGWVLAWAVVEAVLQAQVNYRYSGWGLLLWLVLILLIGVFSSLAPARDAARLTVREVLEYE